MSWYKLHDKQIELRIFAKPNAKKTALIDVNEEQGLVVVLHAKPQEGEANKELIRFLSQLFTVPKSFIELDRGGQSRYKKILMPRSVILDQFIENPFKFCQNDKRNK